MAGKDYRYRQCNMCDRFKNWKNTNAVRHLWREHGERKPHGMDYNEWLEMHMTAYDDFGKDEKE